VHHLPALDVELPQEVEVVPSEALLHVAAHVEGGAAGPGERDSEEGGGRRLVTGRAGGAAGGGQARAAGAGERGAWDQASSVYTAGNKAPQIRLS
jgi:hypothetical protein